MSLTRLNRKTNPKALGVRDTVDFESEIRAYKEGIEADIETYKGGDFIAPDWVKEAIEEVQHMKQIKPEDQVIAISAPRSKHAASSSSSWERPISDSQAVSISD